MLRLMVAARNPGKLKGLKAGDALVRAFVYEDTASGRHEGAAFQREAQRRGWQVFVNPHKFRDQGEVDRVLAAVSSLKTATGLGLVMSEKPKAPGDAYWDEA